MNIPVYVQVGNLPSGLCFTTFQDLLNSFMGACSFSVQNGFAPVVLSPTQPAVNQQGAVWFQTDSLGNPIRAFVFANGQWISPNPRPPSSGERMIWTQSESALWSYDGGDGTCPNDWQSTGRTVITPTATTGAMWQVDGAFQFKFPLGYGTSGQSFPEFNGGNPDTVPVAASVTTAGQTGESRHYQSPYETSIHAHFVGRTGFADHTGSFNNDNDFTISIPSPVDNSFLPITATAGWRAGAASTGSPGQVPSCLDLASALNLVKNLNNGGGTTYQPTAGSNGAVASAPVSANTLPPFYSVAFASRTSRQYYTP